MAHVRVGQRWRFEHSNGQVRTWDVLAVAPDLVTYRETITHNGRLMGEPADLTWAARSWAMGTWSARSWAVDAWGDQA